MRDAIKNDTSPAPQPRSRTRIPAPMPERRRTSSVRSPRNRDWLIKRPSSSAEWPRTYVGASPSDVIVFLELCRRVATLPTKVVACVGGAEPADSSSYQLHERDEAPSMQSNE